MKNYIWLITMFIGVICGPLDAMSVKKVKNILYEKLSKEQPLKLEKGRKPTEGFFDAGNDHAEAGYKMPIQTDEQKHAAFSCHFSKALSSFLQAHLQGHIEAMKHFKEVEAYVADNDLVEASRRHMLEKEKLREEQKAIARQRSSSLRSTYQRQQGPETFEAGMAQGREAICLFGKHLSLWPDTAVDEAPAQDSYSQLQLRFKDLKEAEEKFLEAIRLFIKAYDEGYLLSLTEAKRHKKFLDRIQIHKANYRLLFWACIGLSEASAAIEERWKAQSTNSPAVARLTISDPCANCVATDNP